MSMKGKYYFCFRFNSITLLNDVQDEFIADTNFQI